jgi:hypothetical protein
VTGTGAPNPPFLDALREELLAAAARQIDAGRPIRPRPRLAVAAAGATTAVLAVAMGVLLTLSAPAPAQADVRVEVEGGRVIITLVELEHRPERIQAVAQGAGLDVTVSAVPVGPSLVGRFVRSTGNGALPPELHVLGTGPTTFAGFSLPEDWRGSLHLSVGRPADDGEAYVAYSDAFAEGEPLHCAGVLGAPATEALALVEQLPLHADWELGSVDPVTRVRPADLREGIADGLVVVRADAVAADRVVLRLAPPADAVTPAPPSRC